MKTFFVIFVLLLVAGYGAMMLGVIGIVLFAAGVLAAVIALQINQYFLQERIEKKLDRLLSDREGGEAAVPAEELAEEQEPVEEQEETE